jgi:GT2 family glycosyltransferase
MSLPRISVVIATKGRPDDLRATLASLARLDPAPEELLVVDGDPDRSAEPVAGEAPAATYLHTPPGLTLQRNRGVRAAGGDVVVFLDDDVDVDTDLLARLGAAYADPAVVGATGRVIEGDPRRFGNKRSRVRRLLFRGPDGTFTRFGYPLRLQDVDSERDVQLMQGCLMSARRASAEAVGFDEQLAGYGLAEDEDFSCRLSRTGRVRYMPDAVVRHKNTGMTSSAVRRFNRDVVVNRAYLFRKNFARTPTARAGFCALVALLIAHRVVNREWDGVRGLLDGSVQAWRAR